MTRFSLPVGDIDLHATLMPVAFMRRDPTVSLAPGRFRRATMTPEGPATVAVSWGDDRRARVATHGDGGRWLADRAPGLLGCLDRPEGFEPRDEPFRSLWRTRPGLRLTRTSTLWHDLAWMIVQQRITTVEAAAQWRRLTEDLGAPAPGAEDLRTPPPPEVLASVGYHHLHRYGIERRRADTLVRTARAMPRLVRLVEGPVEAAVPTLRAVPGIGPWTSTYAAVQTWGDPDTVIVGDAGLPSLVAWLAAGERRADDARMLELLEPYRPHRARIVRLAMASGRRPPRRRPRAARDDIRRR